MADLIGGCCNGLDMALVPSQVPLPILVRPGWLSLLQRGAVGWG
jgi:hypothetical protein